MKKKIVFLHTVPGTVLSMKRDFPALFPNAQLINILDDGILDEVAAHGGEVTPDITARLVEYCQLAQNYYGASAVACMCTTIAPKMDVAAQAVSIPVLKIDGPMMDQAVQLGRKIAILCTAPFTLNSSASTCRSAAQKAGRQVEVTPILVPDAFDANLRGETELHDRLVSAKAHEVAGDYDVIVMAQVTMKRVADTLTDLGKPVLASVPAGLEQLRPYAE
jgi:glutamate racemase